MEELTKNLTNWYWWLELAIPAVVFWLTGILFTKALKWTKRVSIKQRNERDKFIARICSDDLLIMAEVGLRNCYYTAFILAAVVFTYMLALKPFDGLIKTSPLVGLLYGSPILLLEVMWLNKDVLVKDILKKRKP